MKKRINIIMFVLVILIIQLLSSYSLVYAANKVYYISGCNINVAINSDGSADIEEQLTYNYEGKFNGALRNVHFSDSRGIKNQKVYVLKDGNLQEWKLNSTKNLDASGRPGTYNFVIEDNFARFKIFEPSNDEEKTFVIKYRLLDVVRKYYDIAEFNRKLIDSEWETRLDNINITITLPEGATKEEIKVFAHGPLTGESQIIDSQNVAFTVPSVSPGTFVETRVLFPTRLVPGSKNIINITALPGIMQDEGKLAEEANEIRENARKQVEEQQKKEQLLQSIGIPLVIVLLLAWFPLIIYIYIKYDKELKHTFNAKYYRELPGEYTPAEMSVLMSFGYVQSRDIMATLMDLVRKKQLKLTVNKEHKKGLFGGKELTHYLISLNDAAPAIQLKMHEEYLIGWFINQIGNGTSVAIDEIEAYVRKQKNALQFKSDYDTWCKLAKEEGNKNKFFDKTCKNGRIIGIFTGFLYLVIGAGITALLYTLAAPILSIFGVILILFSVRIKRRTAYGNEQYAMWQAFKNFLKDFSRLNKAEIPAIVLWEHYLVYAISLGVAKEVIKQLPLVFKDGDFNDTHLIYMNAASYGYLAGFSSMFDNTIHTVQGAIDSAVSIANSSNSSASGSGGGFSGGDSGGGGGGGGGGAF